MKLHPLTFCSWLNSRASCCAWQKWLVINFQSLMALLSAPGLWINKNLIFPPQSLESYPTERHFQRHQRHNWLILGPERQSAPLEESLISSLRPKQSYSPIHAVQWLIITAQLNWTHCWRACKPALYADWFMSCESETLRKTYHHSFVLVSVYRPLCIDDYCIRTSLISGFCVEDKWKNKRKEEHSEIRWRKRLMSKHFNYRVKYEMKGNIYKQISVKFTLVCFCFFFFLFYNATSVPSVCPELML